MSDVEERAEITQKREATVKQLLRRAVKRTRPSRFVVDVPHGRETDANREFASHRNGDDLVWFFGALSLFIIIYVMWMKVGAI